MGDIQRTPIFLPETENWKYPKKSIKECKRCGSFFLPRSPRSQFCDECRREHELERARERAAAYRASGRKYEVERKHYKIVNGKRVYVHTGRLDQSGSNNANYKNGTGIDWFQKALEVLPARCNRCGITEEELQQRKPSKVRYLLIHHKDGNHNNNSPDNWEILCKKCHQHHHSKTDDRGRFVSEKV